MAIIKVDFDNVKKLSKSVDTFIEIQESKMKTINNTVQEIGEIYEGTDYTSIFWQWSEMYGGSKNNTFNSMKKAYKSYAKILRFSMSEYKKAQENATWRAKKL